MHGVDPSQVVAGAGSDDILEIVMKVVGHKGVIVAPPTFGMYTFLANLAGVKITSVERKPAPSFAVDIPGMVAAVRQSNAKLVVLASPNNPTGTQLPLADVATLCAEECVVLIDEAYADFSGITAMDLLASYPNLIVCRTFSKWAGLAGLRIGYSVGHADITKVMLAVKQPYNVNVCAEAAAIAAIGLKDEILETDVAMMLQVNAAITSLLSNYIVTRPGGSYATINT